MQNKNLAFGLSVGVEISLDESKNCVTQALTNGKLADIGNDLNWILLQGGDIALEIDLGNNFAVSGFSLGFAHEENSACPENVKFLLSENKSDFYEVANVKAPYPASFKVSARANYEVMFSSPCRARFAKIKFRGETRVKCDELRIFGSELNGEETYLSGASAKEINKNRFAHIDSLSDCANLPLLTIGGDKNRFGRDEFKPYLAYMNNSGAVTDSMFDSLAFVFPTSGDCPSGGCLTAFNEKPSILSDWEFLIDDLFSPNANLKALDEEYASVKQALGLERNRKLKIFLQAPLPKISFSSFGDLNGDGIKEKLLTTEDCITAFNWFVDAVTRRFNAECLPNLKIAGFIWNDNKIARQFRDDEEFFVRECVAGLHHRGYKCLFVGSRLFGGAERAEKVGIDCTTLFSEDYNNGIDAFAVSACRKYGLGICLSLSSETALRQLNDCLSNGLVNTVHCFANANLLSECCYSNDGKRLLYDEVYNFIKTKFQTETVDEALEKTAAEEVTEAEIEDIEFKEIVSPETSEKQKEIVEEKIEETVEEITEESVEKDENSVIVEISDCQTEETVKDDFFEEVSEVKPELKIAKDEKLSKVKEEPIECAEETAKEQKTEETVFDEPRFEVKQYEVPTLKIEISVPTHEESCPDKRCGHCKKFEPIAEEKTESKINKCDKRVALAAAGIALTLGAVYIIIKSTKGKNNG